MSRFVRFETSCRCRFTNRRLGVFHAAGEILDRDEMDGNMREQLEGTLDWFNAELKVPTLEEYGWRSVFWYFSDSRQFISRMWELACWLELEGVFVTKRWTHRPGRIVYADEHQVAAVPNRARN